MAALLVLLLLLAAPARAQEEPPACTPEREGMTACFAEKLCLCRFQPGGQLSGRPSGHRWDCGVLRPHCGVAPAGPPPSPVVPGYGGYPTPYGGEREGGYPGAYPRPAPGRISTPK
ncbi:hypothetical protein JYK14_26565 [Siccirubricoccus sp. KC 17139]|uniref:Uncharacterized protein n=1 Tax=Siccirubricoccus soli TaxID=2899147 RepID=A0ABT1DCN4_9PROT|nr:hypothetical protein [Siccirubricoccus soli]MCO6419703.1 hypothetical protein [Siccirubricoccus soli]MCP2685838.1 hypothetical protein [Siccirubricoccus soli]